VVFGHPIIGAIISTALAAGATCWMVRGWVPSFWALVGGLLVATHGTLHLSWSMTYKGGSLAMLGGALMFGSLPRIQTKPRIRDAVLMGTGAILLYFTRPFEGLVVGTCVAVAILVTMFEQHPVRIKFILARFILPASLVLLAGLSFSAYYNSKITGDPFTLPYKVHADSYGKTPIFLWQSPRQDSIDYNHRLMESFYTKWEFRYYQAQQTVSGLLHEKFRRFKQMAEFYFNYGLIIPLLFLPWLFRPKLRFVWVTLAIFFVSQLTLTWTHAHYLAPIAPLFFILVVQGMRLVSVVSRRHPWIIVAIPLALVLHLIFLGMKFQDHRDNESRHWLKDRISVTKELGDIPGQHVVFVKYRKPHWVHAEWVYNNADIDSAKIVWARDMGERQNRLLVDYYPGHNIWLAEVKKKSVELQPYSEWQNVN
jgi:hypothetical protein